MKALNCNRPAVTDYLTQDRPTLSKGKAIIEFKWIAIDGINPHTFEGTQPCYNYRRTLGQERSHILDDARGFTHGESFPFIPSFNCGTYIKFEMRRHKYENAQTLKISSLINYKYAIINCALCIHSEKWY